MALHHRWDQASPLVGMSLECPHCGTATTPLLLLQSNGVSKDVPTGKARADQTNVLACSSCTMPFIALDGQRFIPSPRLGRNVRNIPEQLSKLYDEARDASSVGANTACAMVARKLLMNLGVLEGAEKNKNFQYYVDYLANNGFVPAKGRPWVDKIRLKGNEATHEIELVSAADAKDIMYLVENLLRFNFEMTGPT